MSVFTKIGSIVNIRYSGKLIYRSCSTRSCLFISGKYGTGLASVVIPDVDIEQDLLNKNFEENFRARKIDPKKFDLKAIANSAKYLDWLDAEETRLEVRRQEIAQKISEFGPNSESEEKDRLVAESREVKQAMKSAMRNRWEVEDSAVFDYFQLPNRLSDRTPINDDRQVYIFDAYSDYKINFGCLSWQTCSKLIYLTLKTTCTEISVKEFEFQYRNLYFIGLQKYC
jgi:seryl-tRNA synthetase